jgi:hypothetical protein
MKIIGMSSLGQSRIIYNQTGIKEAFIDKRGSVKFVEWSAVEGDGANTP